MTMSTGLNLLPVINNLRKTAQNVADIKVQLDVFDEQRESDEVQSLQDPDGINLNSHLDVFYAILRQVNKLDDDDHFRSLSLSWRFPHRDNRDFTSDSIASPSNHQPCISVCPFVHHTGGRHATRHSIPEHIAALAAHRLERGDQRCYLGHGRDAGASCHLAGES